MTKITIRRIDVFFYELFMDEALLKEKGINPVNPRIAWVENFSLVIGKRATLVPSENKVVYGVLFSLSHNEVEMLYSEESVRAYRPEGVCARLLNGNVAAALCFNLPLLPAKDERNPEYVSKLRTLANRIGLPPDYVASIQ